MITWTQSSEAAPEPIRSPIRAIQQPAQHAARFPFAPALMASPACERARVPAEQRGGSGGSGPGWRGGRGQDRRLPNPGSCSGTAPFAGGWRGGKGSVNQFSAFAELSRIHGGEMLPVRPSPYLRQVVQQGALVKLQMPLPQTFFLNV